MMQALLDILRSLRRRLANGWQPHADEALRDSEARHRAILEGAVSGIITIDEKGIIESANRAAERLFGYTAAEMVGRNVTLLMPEPYRSEHDQHLANYRSAGVRRVIGIGREVMGRKKDGTIFPMDLAVSELRVGGRRMFTGLISDLTERKRFEAERDRLLESERCARAEAERASRAKDEFIAVLSHELRTPLTPALLAIGVIEDDPDLPERYREAVQMIRRNVELEARLIDDLLDLTRVASGKLSLQPELTDLHALIRNAIQICQKSVGIELHVDLSAGEAHVNGDPARLQQVLWNVLNNAYKFTPMGGSVSVRTSNPEPTRLRVEISDTGRGIDADVLPRIFNAFEQGNVSVARRFGGLGLGLAISQAIMQAHGGSIAAASPGKGKGAVFTIELDAAAPARESAHGKSLRPPAALRPMRILLVEDHDATLRMMSRILRHLGHETRAAANVREAVDAAEGGSFDIVISDIGLPDGTGYELMRLLKSRFRLKGVALSGYGMPEDVRRSLDAGFDQHLVKPVDIHRLSAVVANLSRGIPEPDRQA